MQRRFAALVPQLQALGFFSRVPNGRTDESLRSAADYPFAAIVHRSYHADAEALAEGHVLAFIASTRDFLASQDVDLAVTFRPMRIPLRVGETDPDEPPIAVPIERMSVTESRGGPRIAWTESFTERAYVIDRGGHPYPIWTDSTAQSWQQATVRTVALLNELLIAHGSHERAWAINGGNDLDIAFATPDQARVINEHLDERDRLHDGTAM